MRIIIYRELDRLGYADYRLRWRIEVLRQLNHYEETVLARDVVEGEQSQQLYSFLDSAGLAWTDHSHAKTTTPRHPMGMDLGEASIDGLILAQVATII